MDILGKHGVIERNATLLLSLSLAVVCIGGIVEVAPLFYFQNTIEKVEGMRPYSPLELAGREIYICEGQYVAPDDATNNNGANNAFWRRITRGGNTTNWTFAVTGSTIREQAAIFAWPRSLARRRTPSSAATWLRR